MVIDKPDKRDGRQRLLSGAGRLLAERGYAGMELRDVATVGAAPRGSIYHHFPGGKAQLAAEAAELDGVRIRIGIERSLVERGLKQTLRLFADFFRRQAAGDPTRIGCPVAAAALALPEDGALAGAATAAFAGWEGAIAAALEREAVAPERSAQFAAVVVSTVEGALIRARAAADLAPLDAAIAGLEGSLDDLLAASR